jgi:NDP-sugar pyrophosphorylase family protein
LKDIKEIRKIMKCDVFLLAAGESSRMFPLNSIMEKSLLPVNGKPVIRHIIENLTVPEVARHLRKITICCLNKFKKQFEHEFRDMPSLEIMGFEKPLGTATTLVDALHYETNHNNPDEWIMVHYADCITDLDYSNFLKSKMTNDEIDGIIAVTDTIHHDYSEVVLSLKEHFTAPILVHEFNEKPKLGYHSWTGIALLRTGAFLANMVGSENKDIAQNYFPILVQDKKLEAFATHAKWYDVGNLNSYRKVCEMFNHI